MLMHRFIYQLCEVGLTHQSLKFLRVCVLCVVEVNIDVPYDNKVTGIFRE